MRAIAYQLIEGTDEGYNNAADSGDDSSEELEDNQTEEGLSNFGMSDASDFDGFGSTTGPGKTTFLLVPTRIRSKSGFCRFPRQSRAH